PDHWVSVIEAALIPLSPRDVLLRHQYELKQAWLDLNKPDDAIKILQNMLLVAPKNKELWQDIAQIQAERGHLYAAMEALKKQGTKHVMTPALSESMLEELRYRLN
ncbi:MAG: tetratricopeptide repeat protein, partial [Cellvibrionaceae bacterium]|nr:tetratricopeptide repeat protein [Cellvibrionaceae bacterium]